MIHENYQSNNTSQWISLINNILIEKGFKTTVHDGAEVDQIDIHFDIKRFTDIDIGVSIMFPGGDSMRLHIDDDKDKIQMGDLNDPNYDPSPAANEIIKRVVHWGWALKIARPFFWPAFIVTVAVLYSAALIKRAFDRIRGK